MSSQEGDRPPRRRFGTASAVAAQAAAGAAASAAPAPSAAQRSSDAPMVPHDLVAQVIGRAAALEQERGAGSGAGMDEQAIVEIGLAVGLEPADVRAALAEYHAGLLTSDTPPGQTMVGPRVLEFTRTMPGPRSRVDAGIASLLEAKVFECCRRSGDRTVWRPREGMLASLQRTGKRLSSARVLDDVSEITVTTVTMPPAHGDAGQVRVHVLVECRSLRQGLAATAVAGTALGGVGAVAAVGAAIAAGDALPLLGLPPLGALAAGSYLGPRAVYRRKLAEVELVLQGGLDELDHAAGPMA